MAANVSVSTASRALNGGRYVAGPVVSRVLAAAGDLGYSPNEGARGLRKTETMTVGVIAYQLRQLPFLDFLDGFGAELERIGYVVLVANARENDDLYRSLMTKLFERRVDGLLVAGPGDLGDTIRPYQASGRPVLAALGRGSSAADVIPLVMSSEVEAVNALMRRLAELGHRSVAFFGSPWTPRSVRPSIVAHAAATEGMNCQMAFLPPTDPDAIAQHLHAIVGSPANATALVVNNALVGAVIKATRTMGISIPSDLSVVTFTDSPLTEGLVEPALSSIHTDAMGFGARAAATLAKWMKTGIPPPYVTDVSLSSWSETGSIGPAPVRG